MGGRIGQRLGGAGASQSNGKSLSDVENRIRTQNFESAALYIDGKQVFFKDGEASRVSFTFEEAKLMRDGVLTHNHPGGRSFSPADFRIFNNTKMKEIRAVSREWNYSLTNNRGNINEARLNKIMKDADKVVRTRFGRLVDNDEMTVEFANANHHHEVNLIVAAKTGFTYKRSKNG